MSRAVLVLLVMNVAVFAAGILVLHGHERIIDAAALWFPDNPHFEGSKRVRSRILISQSATGNLRRGGN